MSTVYTWEEVKKHNSAANGVWIVIDGSVYDVSKFMAEHPGGDDVLAEQGGKDATQEFKDVGHSSEASRLMAPLKIGTIAK